MCADAPLTEGETVEWIGATYEEDGIGRVTFGDRGTLITTDGPELPEEIVVQFERVGAFCCGRNEVCRLPRD
jgi:hypothetical protein